MYNLITILTLFVFILLVIGFFKPQKSLFWYKGERTKKQSLIFYIPTFFILGMIGLIIEPKDVKEDRIKREQELVKKREIRKEEERLNSVHGIENCNDFKDNPEKYTGLNIQDVFLYSSSNTYNLRSTVNGTRDLTKEKTVTVSFYHYDEKLNRCDIDVEIPVDLNVPNVQGGGEKVLLTFNCSQGNLTKGNLVKSIRRVE
jgi:hypothetical protein